jgi:hypothetical protein
MTGDVDVYSLTGIDREEWLIIGMDFGGGVRPARAPRNCGTEVADG